MRVAVDAGAHAVYCGFADETNARNFPGLNFSREELGRGRRLRPPARREGARGRQHFSRAPARCRCGVARWTTRRSSAPTRSSLADLGLLDYAASTPPGLRLHLSVQAAAANAEAINFYADAFGIKRVVLPRVLTVQEIAAINAETEVETEVFVFGGLA